MRIRRNNPVISDGASVSAARNEGSLLIWTEREVQEGLGVISDGAYLKANIYKDFIFKKLFVKAA